MELTIKNQAIPIKAIPEIELNTMILTVFMPWVSNLLSLTGETSKERLKIAVPAIKKQCWSMGFDEIKNMFEMYADGQMSIKPIPNYFDRILIGQIFNEYRQIKRTKPIAKDTDKEKEQQDLLNVINWFDFFIQNRKVTEEMTWIYDYLILKDKYFVPKKKFENKLKQAGIDEGLSIEKAKLKTNRTMIKLYFEKLEDKGVHIKNLL